MMMSPETYVWQFKDKSYEECIKERDKLIRSIRRFEKGKVDQEHIITHPSPDVIYHCELEYLSQICNLIADKYLKQKEKMD